MNARRSHSKLAATLLVLVLALGALAHLWHHLTGADCERLLDRHSTPCASCVGLHGAVLTVALPDAPLPRRWIAELPVLDRSFEAGRSPRHAASPRAPPSA